MDLYRRHERLGYAVAVGATAAATLVRLPLREEFGDGTPFLFYFPAIMVTAWVGGLRPGLLATTLGAVLSHYFFIEPLYSFLIPDFKTGLNLAGYFFVGTFISIISEVMHRTARKLRHEHAKVELQSEQFCVTLGSIGDAVVVTDKDGNINFLNPVAEKLMGVTLAEVKGQNLNDALHIINEETHERAFNPINRVLAEGVVVGLANHTMLISKDGSRYSIEDTAAPIRKPGSDEVTGVVLVFHDVTQKYEKQRATARSESRLKSLFESVHDGIITIDVHGTIDAFNPAAQKMFGYTPEEIIGQNIKTLMPEPYRSLHDEAFGKYIAGGPAKVIGIGQEVSGRRKDGTVFPMDLIVSEFGCNGDRCFTGIVRDITDRKRTEQALWEWGAIVESSDDAIIGKNLEGTITSWNKGAERLYGHTAEEMIGQPITRLIPPSNVEELGDLIARLKLGDPIRHFETVRLHKNGTPITVSLTISPIRDKEGRIVGASKVARDITAQKLADNKLREQQQRFATLAEAMPQFIWTADSDGTVDYMNKQFMEYTGLTAAVGQAENWVSPLHPEEHADVMTTWAEAVRSGHPWEKKIRIRGTDSVYRWFLARTVPMKDEHGKVIKWFGSHTNIEDIVESEYRLRESEHKFRATFDQSAVGIVHVGIDGKPTWSNPGICDMLGYTTEELAEKDFRAVTHPDDLAADEAAYEDMISGRKRTCRLEKRYVRKDGGIVWADLFVNAVLNDKGEPLYAVAIVSDITEKKRLEEELNRRVHDLAEANQRKDEFLAILGHELRNPLAAINNAIQLLTLPKVPEDARLASGVILKQQIEHVGRLVDDIITVSRAVRGRIEIHKEPVAVCDVIERAVQIVEPLIDARRHKLHVKLCNPPVVVTGDKIRLVQMLSNLLSNAAKYTNDGGDITLECLSQGREAVLLVKDNGIGIPPEIMPHIYELCVRGARATQKDHGMGIGLTMVKTIVELHGGTTVAHSDGPDKGAEFTVRLPIREVLDHENPAS